MNLRRAIYTVEYAVTMNSIQNNEKRSSINIAVANLKSHKNKILHDNARVRYRLLIQLAF
jgi:hypothetical protein